LDKNGQRSAYINAIDDSATCALRVSIPKAFDLQLIVLVLMLSLIVLRELEVLQCPSTRRATNRAHTETNANSAARV